MAHPIRRGVSSSQVSSWLPAAGTVLIPSRSPVGQSPIALFAAGEQGAWYDPSDLSTMFQDAAGLSPVTAVEQAVGAVLDKRSAPYSVYFDGNGDYLSLAHATALNLVGVDFTIEAWAYWTGVNATNGFSHSSIVSKDGVSGVSYSSYCIGLNSSKLFAAIGDGSGVAYYQTLSAANALPTNQWVHVAFVRNGTSLKLYQNGVEVAAATQSGTMVDGGKSLLIGYEASQPTRFYFDGYISNVRIVKGTAVYTAAFTPPTSSLTAISNTSLLTCGNSWSSNPTITRNGDAYAHGRNPFVATIGNHARQATSASRPTLSARYNLLTYSEQFDNAAWTKSNVTASSNTDTAPDGASTGDTLAATASNGTALSSYTAVATDYTFSVWLKRKTGTGNVDISAHSGGTWVTQTITSSWARYSVTQTMTAGAKTPGIRIATSGDEVYAWGAQLIVANDLTSNAYQRIAAATDYDSDAAKFPYYLLFDGTDDSLLTGSIDLTGTDKLTVFAGVRKLNDTNTYSVLAEFGDRGSTRAGSFTFHAPAGAGTYQFTLEGSGSKGSYDASTYTAPVTNVLSCYYNIGASTLATEIYPRVNGAIPSLSGTGGGGTGNFGNYALFIGRRNNASLPLNGRMYSLIIRAASSADSLISAVEKWIGAKSRVTL